MFKLLEWFCFAGDKNENENMMDGKNRCNY